MAFVDYRELRKQIDAGEPRQCCEFIREGFSKKWFDPKDFQIRKLAEATIGDGPMTGLNWVQDCDPRKPMGNEGMSLMEAGGGAGAVSTAAFTNIMGQIVYTRVIEAAENPAFIGDQLVEVIPTQFNGEKIPEVGGVGDDNLRVNEAGEYPLLGVDSAFIETPETVKRGGIVPVTKEAIFFDRTNLVLQRAATIGYYAGLNREKEILKTVTGVDNSYKRNGTASDTYKTSGGHGIVNAATNVLADFTDIDETLLLFNNMTDFLTGEVIVVMPNTLLVPWALRTTALNIVNGTEVRGGTSNTTNWQTIAPNPISNIVSPLQVLSSPLIYAVTSETNDWWLGDFPRAFAYMENWAIQNTSDDGGEQRFTRDIVARFRVDWRGVAAVKDPHYVFQSTGGS